MNLDKVLKILIIIGCIFATSTVMVTGVSAHTAQERSVNLVNIGANPGILNPEDLNHNDELDFTKYIPL